VLREREQEVKELRRQLREQELTLERHEQLVLENKAFKARLADLQRERQRLQDDASKHLAAAATAKQQLAEKSVELEGLLDRIARLERERTTLHGEVTSLQASNNSLRSEMLAQSKEASDLKLRHELDRQRVLLLEHERALLQQQVAQSGRQLQQQPPLLQQPPAIHPTAVDSATQLVLEEHKALQERLQAALRTAETLRDEKLAEIEALREQHARDSADLQKRIAEYKAQLHAAVEQKRALEASARSLAEEKELALEQRKQQMQAAAQLQTQITLLRGEVTALKRVVLDHESQARLQAQKYEAVEREKEALRRALAQHDTDRRLAVEEREKALAMLNSALMHSSSAGGVGDNRQEQAAENEHAADMTHAPKEIPGVETHPAPRTPQGFAWCRACSLRQGSTCSIS
jgi:chromosome segregation ATPase